MREILFRGQTRRKGEYLVNMAGDKCDSNWVYGGIFPQNENEKGFAVIYQQEPEIKKYPVYADTVCQYTGLKDRNGKKIFEGDIVKIPLFKPDIMAIGFIEGAFCLVNSKGEYVADIHYVHHANDNQTEIIGNIYDNPELVGE